MYILKKQELNYTIKRYNQLQCEIGNGKTDPKTIAALDTISKNIALVKSQFRCAKCNSENKRLQFHHLILTCYKEIMPINIYYMIRMNYKSILILCKDCHQSYHGKNDKGEDIYFISQERIEKILKEYYEKTENE